MRLRSRTASVVALSATIILGGSAALAAGGGVRPVVEGLNSPRGLSVEKHSVVFAEADGTVSERITKGRHAGTVRELTQVPAGFVAPAVDVGRDRTVWILTAQGAPGSGAGTLYRWRHGYDEPKPVRDIMAYQEEHDPDPDDLEGAPGESNPFGVVALKRGGVLVSDAAGNDLLKVSRHGRITTVARLKPREVAMPPGYPADAGLPPEGTPIMSEAVATSVTVGKNGDYFVGELRGFPATPGTSQVWRIREGARNAVCDPERPYRGKCQLYADGFTSIVDLAADRRGNVYVAELVKESWLAFEFGLVEQPIGSVYKLSRRGGHARELAAGQLILPSGVDVDRRGHVYVAGPMLGEGGISRISR